MPEKDVDKEVKRLMKGIDNIVSRHCIAADVWGNHLVNLLKENPDEGIENISKIYRKALHDAETDEEGNYHGVYSAADPFETVPHAVYNAVGSAYPYLNKEHREGALAQILGILDGIRYDIVQTVHTTSIREPLLLSDIAINRPLYWPGLYEGREIIKKYNNDFPKMQEEIINEKGLFKSNKVKSDFVVAYSLLRSDFWDSGELYVAYAEKEFLDRILRGVVGLKIGWTDTPKEIEENRNKMKGYLPKSLHIRLFEGEESIEKQAGWITKYKH